MDVSLGMTPSRVDGVVRTQPLYGLYIDAQVIDVDEEQGWAKNRSFWDPGDHLAD